MYWSRCKSVTHEPYIRISQINFPLNSKKKKSALYVFPTSYSCVARGVSILDMSSSWMGCRTINRIVQNNFRKKFDFNFHRHERFVTRYKLIIEFAFFRNFSSQNRTEQKSIILSHERRNKKKKKNRANTIIIIYYFHSLKQN